MTQGLFADYKKKCSGKLESFVDKLIKNNKTLIFYKQNKYLEIFQLKSKDFLLLNNL